MSDVVRMKLLEADHPVGVKKKSRYTLPPQDHVYGLPYKMDAEGASIVTRSWQIHEPSPVAKAPKDFIKMNQVNTEEAKNNRKEIRKKPCLGKKDRSMGLPPEGFVYGLKNEPHSPIKDIINNVYGNKAEIEIRKSYEHFLKEKNVVKRLVTRVTPHYIQMKQRKKMLETVEEKPLYKLRMFQDVGSKVTEGIKAFKTYKPYKTESNVKDNRKEDDGLNNIIEKVQGEIKEQEANTVPAQ